MAFNCQVIVGVVFLCLGGILNFVSSSTVLWKFSDQDTLHVFKGLYTICYEIADKEECESIDEPHGYEHGCRFLISTPIVMEVIAVIMAFIHLFKVSKRTASKAMLTTIVVLTIVSVVFLLTGTIVYGASFQEDEKFEDEWELDHAFIVNIVAFIVLIIAAILLQISYSPEQVSPVPQGGAVIIHQYQGQPGQPMPPPYAQPMPYGGQPPAPYGQQPAYYGQQPAYLGQPQPFATGASGQPMPPAYPQASQPGLGQNYNTQYGDVKPAGDAAYPPQQPQGGATTNASVVPPPVQY